MIPSVDLIEPRRRRLIRWIGAATLIGAIHVAGGSLAMLYWQEEFADEAPGAIVVEIASVATAVDTEEHDLLSGKLSPEAEVKQMASAPKLEKSPKETPKEDLPSPAPDPEVVLRKPTEIEKKPQEKPRDEPSPMVKAAEKDTAAAKATAPRRIQGELSTKLAAPTAGTADPGKRAIAAWQNDAILRITRQKQYPTAARRHNIQGVVHVRFSLDSSGQVEHIQIVLSSGFAILDEEAVAMLKRASPLPLPPFAMQGETEYLVLPITFRIK